MWVTQTKGQRFLGLWSKVVIVILQVTQGPRYVYDVSELKSSVWKLSGLGDIVHYHNTHPPPFNDENVESTRS